MLKKKTKVSDEFRRSTDRRKAIDKNELKLAEISILKYLRHADRTAVNKEENLAQSIHEAFFGKAKAIDAIVTIRRCRIWKLEGTRPFRQNTENLKSKPF